MPNKFYNDTTASGPKGGKVNMGPSPTLGFPEKTINWRDLPGKTQPKDRSRGVKKCKCHPVSKGI